MFHYYSRCNILKNEIVMCMKCVLFVYEMRIHFLAKQNTDYYFCGRESITFYPKYNKNEN